MTNPNRVSYCLDPDQDDVLGPNSLHRLSADDKSKGLAEPVHEISNNVVSATSKASDQPAHTHSLIRAFASRLSIL